MKISIACDHGGLALKQQLVSWLIDCGHDVADFGTYDDSSCDYPDFARPASLAVASGKADMGIVVCTTGVGVSMVANHVAGIRCALCTNVDMAKMTRLHNNANMIALGSRYTTLSHAKELITIFINTPFEGGRHQTRVDKIEQ